MQCWTGLCHVLDSLGHIVPIQAKAVDELVWRWLEVDTAMSDGAYPVDYVAVTGV